MTRGKYIVLEGPEGVGKTTQVQMIAKQLRAAGMPVRVLREPDSQSDLTARAIRQITQDPHYPLNTQTEVLLYNAARARSLEGIRNSLAQGVNCIVDRNYLTTLAIQYYGRGDITDYETINRIINFAVNGTEPDLTIVLDAPVQLLKERSKNRYQGERFDNLDEMFLERVRAGYLWEAKQRNIPVVFATEPADEVFKQVWKHVSQTLARRDTKAPAATDPQSVKEILAEQLTNERSLVIPHEAATDTGIDTDTEVAYVEKSESGFKITAAGTEYLERVITNATDNVYAFNEKLSPTTVAAAMARLSRRGDDMRITILDEFAGKADKDAQLLKRVITAYGDDSVQQLVGQHIVVEGASNLLTKKLEWGRLAAYLEQSTRYIYFDKKDDNSKYKYYTPEYLDATTKRSYNKALDTIFDLYSAMVHKLTDYVQRKSSVPEKERDIAWKGATRAQACDAIRPVLPVATKATVGIYASGQALESLIMHLLSDPLPEAHGVGEKILTESRKVIPAFLERVDIQERGVAAQGYKVFTYEAVKSVANELLPASHANGQEPVSLTSYWPRNELELLPDMLYEHSHLSLEEIKNALDKQPYNKRERAFKSYIGERFNRRHKPGRALEKAHYSWDLLCDYGIFRDLQRHRMVDDLEWQALTPRYGYDIPELVEEAGLTEEFEACFDVSLELYSLLQARGYELEAQYATLLGHKMRWKMTMNAREAFHFIELRTTPQGHPGYRKLVYQMYEKLQEVHPMLAEAMKFVNKDEDPELTRLAAERYTQFKLKQLQKPSKK